MKKIIILLLLLFSGSSQAMFHSLGKLFGHSETPAPQTKTPPGIIDLLELLKGKKLEEALLIYVSDRELARAPGCLALAILAGATPDYVKRFRRAYSLNKTHYLPAVTAACGRGSVEVYNAVTSNRLDFEGLESRHIQHATQCAWIFAAANGHFHLMTGLIKDAQAQRAHTLSLLREQRSSSGSEMQKEYATYLSMCDVNNSLLYGITAQPCIFPSTEEPSSVGQEIYSLPLHAAIARGHLDIALLMLLSNADPEIADSSKKTPLELAKKRKNAELITLIELFICWKKVITLMIALEKPEAKHGAISSLFKACPALALSFLKDLEAASTLDAVDQTIATLRDWAHDAVSSLESIKATLKNTETLERLRLLEQRLKKPSL